MNMADMDISKEYLEKFKSEMFKPKVPMQLAKDLVTRLYGVEVTEIKDMNSFNDQNFHVKVSKDHQNPYIQKVCDQGYTLKIINTLKSNMDGHFDSLHTAMNHMLEKGLRVPEPVRNIEGKLWQLETVPLLNKEQRSEKNFKCGIHLLTYVSGVPLAAIDTSPRIFFEWGLTLAKFHNALEDLVCPILKCKPIVSDVKYFPLIGGYLESIKEGALDERVHKLILNVLDRYPSEIGDHLNGLPEGFIHGDLNDYNILVQVKETDLDEKVYTIDGILDFEDIHYGSYVWDLGLMLGHVLFAKKTMDPLEAAGHAVAGYRSLRHLSEVELSLLKVLMECRVSVLSLISVIADEDPTNSYIEMLSSVLEPTRNMLEVLANTNTDDLLKMWNELL